MTKDDLSGVILLFGNPRSFNPSVLSVKVTYLLNEVGKFAPKDLLILTEWLNRFSCDLKRSTQNFIWDWIHVRDANRKWCDFHHYTMLLEMNV